MGGGALQGTDETRENPGVAPQDPHLPAHSTEEGLLSLSLMPALLFPWTPQPTPAWASRTGASQPQFPF